MTPRRLSRDTAERTACSSRSSVGHQRDQVGDRDPAPEPAQEGAEERHQQRARAARGREASRASIALDDDIQKRYRVSGDADRDRRRRSRRALLRDPHQEARPGARGGRLRAQRARRHVRLRRRLLRRDARRDRGRRPARRTPRSRRSSRAGRRSTSTTAARSSPRAATASRRWAAGSCWTSCSGAPRAGRRPALPHRGRPRELADADLVVGADGVNSRCAAARGTRSGRRSSARRSKYIWLGTDRVFDAFKFFIAETEHGVFQVHGYPYSDAMSTFIVETSEETWRRAGLDRAGDLAPGESDEASIAFCEELFADALDGHRLIGNNSRWIDFVTVRNAAWRHENVVLLGDAAHTAHFSIGSGTKLAIEDAIALAWAFREHPGRRARRARGLRGRAPPDRREHAARGAGQPASGSRASRATCSSRRCCSRSTCSRAAAASPTASCSCATPGSSRASTRRSAARGRPPMFTPFKLRELELGQPRRRLADGHVLLARRHARRLPPRPPRRARDRRRRARDDRDDLRLARGPDHARLRRPVPRRAHGRVGADRRLRARARRRAKIGAQLGHSGRKGSTKLMWEGEDEPLEDGNWPLLAPVAAALPAGVSQVPREMTRADMDAVRDQFVAAARARGRGRVRPARAPHGPRLPALLVPVAADEPPQRRVRRRRWRAARASRSRCSRPAAPCGRPSARCRCGSRRPTGARAASTATRRSRSRACCRRPAATSSTSRPARCGPTSSRLRAQLPDAVRRPHPPRGRHPDDRGRRDLELRRRQHDRAGRPRRPVRARAPAPVRPALDAARRRRPGLRVEWVPQYRSGRARRRPARPTRCARRRCAASTRAADAEACPPLAAEGDGMSRVVVVTGGTRGIGRAVAARFEAARRPGRRARGARLRRHDEAAVAASFEGIGGVDVLVNNAGVSSSAPLARTLARGLARADRRQRDRRVPVHARGAARHARARPRPRSSPSPRRPAAPARATPPRTPPPSTPRSG